MRSTDTQHFMLDIEATGVDWNTEELLQIGIVEMNFDGQFWLPGHHMLFEQRSLKKPVSEFAKAHMATLYEHCSRLDYIPPDVVRADILNFFKKCGARPPYVYLAGMNLGNFDVPFLVHHKYLERNKYLQVIDKSGETKDMMVGDFHYRLNEVGGAISAAMNVFGKTDRNVFIDYARVIDGTITLGEEKKHDALYDCYSQIKVLNGVIKMLRRGY